MENEPRVRLAQPLDVGVLPALVEAVVLGSQSSYTICLVIGIGALVAAAHTATVAATGTATAFYLLVHTG